MRIERQALIEIFDVKFAVTADQPEMSCLKLGAVLIAQDGQQKLVAQLRLQRLPVKIKKFRKLRCAAVGQHVPPPRVCAQADSHVVGHNIQHLAHAVILELIYQLLQLFIAADFRIELVVVSNVITMLAAGSGLEDGRGINVRDAQRMQISDKTARILKAKAGVKLQAIRGERLRGALL